MNKNLLKTFLLVAICSITFALCSPAFAQSTADWKEKPVQCGDIKEIYNRYVIQYNMIPMFTGVASARDTELNTIPVPVVFFMDDAGRWMMVEINVTLNEQGENLSCIISLGSGFDSNIDPNELARKLIGSEGT